MSDLSAAAAALGIPEAIVLRSAAARAAETGMTVDEVLAPGPGADQWPDPHPRRRIRKRHPPKLSPLKQREETEETAAPAPAPERTSPASGGTPRCGRGTGPVTRSPIPAEVTAAEAAGLPEVVTVPTAGIRERTNFVFPRWLAAVMLIIPLFALFALGGSATGTAARPPSSTPT